MLPSIPEYFSKFVNPSIDLNLTPKICCPFHSEDTPSFSYSANKQVWRCFGACKFGGDVIALHQKNYRLRSRQEAEDSLYKILGVAKKPRVTQAGEANDSVVQMKTAYAQALLVATTPDAWDELDDIMGRYPVSLDRLEAFYHCRRLATTPQIDKGGL